MFSFFEQPWTLLGAAVITLFGVFTYRSFVPEKRYWWQFLIPVFIAAIAFGLDSIVQTDIEKINVLISTGIKAVEEEDTGAIDAIISANYKDSYHNSKEHLIDHCKRELSRSLVEKNKEMGLQLEISPPTATADLTVSMKFEKDSFVTQNYKQFLSVTVKLHLQKEQDKRWLINRAELLEIDRQRVSWRQIR